MLGGGRLGRAPPRKEDTMMGMEKQGLGKSFQKLVNEQKAVGARMTWFFF